MKIGDKIKQLKNKIATKKEAAKVERKKIDKVLPKPASKGVMTMQNRLILLNRDTSKAPRDNPFKAYRRIWKKKSTSEKAVLTVMFIIFVIYALTLLFPIFWATYNSFKTQQEWDINQFAWPGNPTIDNYVEAFKTASASGGSLALSIFNSVWQASLSTLLGLTASCMTGYIVSKYKFKGSGFIYAVAIFIQVIPLVGAVTGMYQLMWNRLEIADTPFLIWPMWFGGFSFSFLLIYSAFKSVSWSYAESAFIDGANHFTVFVRIMLPAIKPVLASLFIVNFINAWSDYMTAYLYLPSYPPLALTVYLLANDATRIAFPVYLAVIVVSIIPTIILFVSFQKLIMENTNAGGLKG